MARLPLRRGVCTYRCEVPRRCTAARDASSAFRGRYFGSYLASTDHCGILARSGCRRWRWQQWQRARRRLRFTHPAVRFGALVVARSVTSSRFAKAQRRLRRLGRSTGMATVSSATVAGDDAVGLNPPLPEPPNAEAVVSPAPRPRANPQPEGSGSIPTLFRALLGAFFARRPIPRLRGG